MSIDAIKNRLPEAAKDIKLNFGSVLRTGDSGLDAGQIYGIALAVAIGLKDPELVQALKAEAADKLTPEIEQGATAAAAIMSMNNLYYRALHLIEDNDLTKMPARLRMNAMANPPVDKKDFELYSLAVSVVNGCGMCLKSHTAELIKHGITKAAISHALKIPSVLFAVYVMKDSA